MRVIPARPRLTFESHPTDKRMKCYRTPLEAAAGLAYAVLDPVQWVDKRTRHRLSQWLSERYASGEYIQVAELEPYVCKDVNYLDFEGTVHLRVPTQNVNQVAGCYRTVPVHEFVRGDEYNDS